jgi:hypothetical protein
MNAEGKRLICENQRYLREILLPADCADYRRTDQRSAIPEGDLLSCGLRRTDQRKSARSARDSFVTRIAQMDAEEKMLYLRKSAISAGDSFARRFRRSTQKETGLSAKISDICERFIFSLKIKINA